MPVIDLTARRLERLEKAQQETNENLARITEILEAHSRHFERMEEALIGVAERVDRLTTAIARGRTQDLIRLDKLEHRVGLLEKKRRRGKAR
jgi:hypothetical protein